jgi:CubicO group peptidase (beta-lactamase class C family)
MRGREVTRVPTAKVTGEPYAIEPLQKSRRIDLLPLPDREEPKYMRDSPVMATDPEGLGFSTKRLARITSLYQEHVETGDVPGAVVAITRNVKLAYLEAIGFQDRGRTIPMRPDAIFWIASMTNQSPALPR